MSDFGTERDATAFWRKVDQRIDEKIEKMVFKFQSGVVPGGIYTRFRVNSAGWIVWAGTDETLIVELELGEISTDDSDFDNLPHPWAAATITDTLSICANVTITLTAGDFDTVAITIPTDGSYTFRHAATLIGGWINGDIFKTILYVNGVETATVAQLTISADTGADQPLDGSTTQTLTAGDVCVAYFSWTNTLTTPTGARGTNTPAVSSFTVTQL